MPLVPGRHHPHCVALGASVMPETHAAMSAACAGGMCRAVGIVHTSASEPECALRHALAFVVLAVPRRGYFRVMVTAAVHVFQYRALVGLNVGVLCVQEAG